MSNIAKQPSTKRIAELVKAVEATLHNNNADDVEVYLVGYQLQQLKLKYLCLHIVPDIRTL